MTQPLKLKRRADFAARVQEMHSDHIDDACRLEEARQARDAEAAFMASLKTGDAVDGEGVYLGRYEPQDRNGNSLNLAFNVFAAPEDLTGDDGRRGVFTYNGVLQKLEEMQGWHGHAGRGYADDDAFYNALASGDYNGEWTIPPFELLYGYNPIDNRYQGQNFYTFQNRGAFKDTFVEDTSNTQLVSPEWYWSCTMEDQGSDWKQFLDFSNGYCGSGQENREEISCRLVRLVPIPQGGPA
jgi:hypothetical protein